MLRLRSYSFGSFCLFCFSCFAFGFVGGFFRLAAWLRPQLVWLRAGFGSGLFAFTSGLTCLLLRFFDGLTRIGWRSTVIFGGMGGSGGRGITLAFLMEMSPWLVEMCRRGPPLPAVPLMVFFLSGHPQGS